MKVIIAGPRTIYDTGLVRRAVVESGFEITELVSGCASGIDQAALDVAAIDGWPEPMRFKAVWRKPDGSTDIGAGIKRNLLMAQYADALIAIWDGVSTGTKNMIDTAYKLGLKVFILRTDQ